MAGSLRGASLEVGIAEQIRGASETHGKRLRLRSPERSFDNYSDPH